jgi:hypothetical protein
VAIELNQQIDSNCAERLSCYSAEVGSIPGLQMPPISDLSELLKSLEPALNPGTFVYATLERHQDIGLGDIVALVREPEGVSVVVDEKRAASLGLKAAFRCAWITLTVASDLQAVGLTAAFASALSSAGVSCNVVAGANHDHIFVPADLALAAMDVLRRLQKSQSCADTI